MKKKIAAFLALSMMLGALTGCSTNKQNEPVNVNTTTTPIVSNTTITPLL